MGSEKRSEDKEIPAGQVWFDTIYLWFALGMVITAVSFSVWGLIEVFGVAPAP